MDRDKQRERPEPAQHDVPLAELGHEAPAHPAYARLVRELSLGQLSPPLGSQSAARVPQGVREVLLKDQLLAEGYRQVRAGTLLVAIHRFAGRWSSA